MHYRIAGTLSIFTTLRRSEVLGLRLQDIDFEKRTLTVAHGLRHTAVSNMIAGGFDLITAGDIAGYSQKSTTANIYAHAIENNKKAASNALEINLLKRRNG